MANDKWVVLAERAAAALEGTCSSLQQVLTDLDADGADDNAIFCARLDDLVFECEQCNWWFEQSEMAERTDERWICEDCTGEDE